MPDNTFSVMEISTLHFVINDPALFQLYRAVGVRVMLVGLDIWSYKDQIEVSANPEFTLSRFLKWRQQSLLARIKHDNAQFIT